MERETLPLFTGRYTGFEIGCVCGFSCGTQKALDKHLARFPDDPAHAAKIVKVTRASRTSGAEGARLLDRVEDTFWWLCGILGVLECCGSLEYFPVDSGVFGYFSGDTCVEVCPPAARRQTTAPSESFPAGLGCSCG